MQPALNVARIASRSVSVAMGRLLVRTVLATALTWHAPIGARADEWIRLSPGPGYIIECRVPNARPVIARPQVDRDGPSPVDRWFQVAPNGTAIALWSAATGLAVLKANATTPWVRKGEVTAFRFSPAGDQLAIASAKGIEILPLDTQQPRLLASLSGITSLKWTAGLIARTRSRLYLIDSTGKQRTLAASHPALVFAAAGGRVVCFANGTLISLDLANPATPSTTILADRDPVVNAALSPDGRNLLFATARRVYLSEAGAKARPLANIAGVESLFVSADGSAFLWANSTGEGAVLKDGKTTALPTGTRAARFSQTATGTLVLTAPDGIASWDPATGIRIIQGGISPDDGVNLAGDLAGPAWVALYYKKTSAQKESETPRFPPR
jgi:WD40 repeat protein